MWTWARETAGHYARNCVTMTGFGHAGADPNMVSGSRECEVGMEYEEEEEEEENSGDWE